MAESNVMEIKAELDKSQDTLKDASVDLGGYDASIAAVAAAAHEAVDGSSKEKVRYLFEMIDQVAALMGGLSEGTEQAAEKVGELRDNL